MSEQTSEIRFDATRVYTRDDLCRAFTVTPRCINKRVAAGELPKPDRKVGRTRTWSGAKLVKWFQVEAVRQCA
jgi:hypothetical protein